MVFCSNCGKIMENASSTCPYCGATETKAQQSDPIIPVDSTVKEDYEAIPVKDTFSPDFEDTPQSFTPESTAPPSAVPTPPLQQSTSETLPRPNNGKQWEKTFGERDGSKNEPVLENGVKVILTFLVTILIGIGPLGGIITGIILMKNKYLDYRRFGKCLLVLSIVLLVPVLCFCAYIVMS